MNKRGWTAAGLGLLLSAGAAAAFGDVRAEDVVRKVDELYRAKTSRTTAEMEIVTPSWTRTLKMESWSEGMDKTLIRILEPKKESGVTTLRLGNEMWNYLPKTDKIMKVPPSMMMSSWMGSDLTNDDLVKEFSYLESYDFEFAPPPEVEAGLLYVKCVPKEGLPIVWGHVLLAVREEGLIPLRQKYYDEKGRLMRVVNFRDVRVIGGRRIPSVMEFLPQDKEGNRTVFRLLSGEFDIPLEPDVFSLRNLRKRT
ncbi:MAG: outer membrane lipoprotein-sorting protein [Candidatus Aminicenantes bacterium]|nr:outer membrane lipoprotein-sorting protein [Candidatus Aminicenantes bacterium]